MCMLTEGTTSISALDSNWRLCSTRSESEEGLKIFFFEAPIIIAFVLELCAENGMLKTMIAAMAVALAGSSTIYAQQQLGGPSGGDRNLRVEQRYRPSADDIKAFTDARIAALSAGLELTPQQETNWPPFEQAVRDLAAQVAERVEARENSGEQKSPFSPFDRLQRWADAMARLAAALKGVADAGTPLVSVTHSSADLGFLHTCCDRTGWGAAAGTA